MPDLPLAPCRIQAYITRHYRPTLIFALSLGDNCVDTSQYTAASCTVPTHTRWQRRVYTCCGQAAWRHTDDERHEAATSQHSAMCRRRVSTRNPSNMAQAVVVVVVILGCQLLQIYRLLITRVYTIDDCDPTGRQQTNLA